jgi:hypothetical protein
MEGSARDYVIRTAEDAQNRFAAAEGRVAGALTNYSPSGDWASEARAAVTDMAADAASHTEKISGDVSRILADQMSALAGVASDLASSSSDLADREASIAVLEDISISVDRLRASYEDEIRSVNGLAEDSIRDHAEKNLARKDVLESREREARAIGAKLRGATLDLVKRFNREAERRGLKPAVMRAIGFLEFDDDFSRRVGSLEEYSRSLAKPIGVLESRFAELYDSTGSGLAGVYSREELNDLNGRLDEVL